MRPTRNKSRKREIKLYTREKFFAKLNAAGLAGAKAGRELALTLRNSKCFYLEH